MSLQRFKGDQQPINLVEIKIETNPDFVPTKRTVMMWNNVTEDDLNQECPQSHPFAFDRVLTIKSYKGT